MPTQTTNTSKILSKSPVAIIFLSLTILSAIASVLPNSKDFVSLLTVSGYLSASLIHASRNLSTKSYTRLARFYTAMIFATTIVCTAIAVISRNLKIIGGPITDTLLSTATLVLLIRMHTIHLNTFKSYNSTKTTVIILLCLLILPTAAHMLSGIFTTVISIVSVASLSYLIRKSQS